MSKKATALRLMSVVFMSVSICVFVNACVCVLMSFFLSVCLQVMEYASLRSLTECLKKPTAGRPMSVVLMCDFALQVSDAMAYLENRRIVHQSLSARNILVFAADKVCKV